MSNTSEFRLIFAYEMDGIRMCREVMRHLNWRKLGPEPNPEFKEPVHVGNWVNFTAKIVETGHSSIVIKVDAYKESHEDDQILACTAMFTMVSVKKNKDGSYKKVNHQKSI